MLLNEVQQGAAQSEPATAAPSAANAGFTDVRCTTDYNYSTSLSGIAVGMLPTLAPRLAGLLLVVGKISRTTLLS